MGFMMVALRQHLPRPFNSAMEVHCANYFQMVSLRRVFSSSLAQPTFPICPNKKPATSSRRLPSRDASAGRGALAILDAGRRLHARTLPNQRTEAKIGCNGLNRMTSLGMPVSILVK